MPAVEGGGRAPLWTASSLEASGAQGGGPRWRLASPICLVGRSDTSCSCSLGHGGGKANALPALIGHTYTRLILGLGLGLGRAGWHSPRLTAPFSEHIFWGVLFRLPVCPLNRRVTASVLGPIGKLKEAWSLTIPQITAY